MHETGRGVYFLLIVKTITLLISKYYSLEIYPIGVYNVFAISAKYGEAVMENRKEKQCCRHKERSEKEYKDLVNRLNRVEGQIRGIRKMIEEDVYCPDILIQVAAAKAALDGFNKVLLGNHIRDCVREDIRAGKDETIDELIGVLGKLMK